MNQPPKLKSDRYKAARGGRSRLLTLSCGHCDHHVGQYQKDGPGFLKRLYLDRLTGYQSTASDLVCPGCQRKLGTLMIYAKEQRPAYRLHPGALRKKTVGA